VADATDMTAEERAAKCLEQLVGEETTMGHLGSPHPANDPNRWTPRVNKGEAYTVILTTVRDAVAAALGPAAADRDERLLAVLVELYVWEGRPFLRVAELCDEVLDRSGGLLGRVRDAAIAARRKENPDG
jgi:hypothetical protein